MSDASTDVEVLYDASPDSLPLSVMLFHAAMSQHLAISDFAEQLGIGALSLRQFISGQTQRPRGRTLELIASTLNISAEEARYRTTLRPVAAPSFADWLKEHMHANFSRARLTRETRISDGALRNYLSGQTLPDADQSQRLAEALGVDSLELACILVADHTIRAGGETLLPPQPFEGDDVTSVSVDPLPHQVSLDRTLGERSFSINRDDRALPADRSVDEEHVLHLWHQLHPQGRRATLIYIAGLLAEG